MLYSIGSVSYTHLRAHETVLDLVCRLLLEKKKHTPPTPPPHLTHDQSDIVTNRLSSATNVF